MTEHAKNGKTMNIFTGKFEPCFSQQDINEIINLRCEQGTQLDIFNLGGHIMLDDDTIPQYPWGDKCRFSSHSLHIDHDDFTDCQTEEEVHEQFNKSLKEIIIEKLL